MPLMQQPPRKRNEAQRFVDWLGHQFSEMRMPSRKQFNIGAVAEDAASMFDPRHPVNLMAMLAPGPKGGRMRIPPGAAEAYLQLQRARGLGKPMQPQTAIQTLRAIRRNIEAGLPARPYHYNPKRKSGV